MIQVLLEIGKWGFKRLTQPTSAASLAILAGYFGIDQAEELTNHFTTALVSLFAIYGIIKDDKSA